MRLIVNQEITGSNPVQTVFRQSVGVLSENLLQLIVAIHARPTYMSPTGGDSTSRLLAWLGSGCSPLWLVEIIVRCVSIIERVMRPCILAFVV